MREIQIPINNHLQMTEIGNFPDEWKIKNLVEIADFETGKRMKGGGLEEGDVISLGGEHISEDGRIQFKKLKFISNSFYNGLKKGKLHNNDILIVKDGARTGKVAISKGLDQKIAINEHIFLIRTKNPNICNNLFLFFILFSHIGQIQVKKAYHGLIGGITREDLSNFLIPLPPLPEQRAIAHVLRTVQDAREKTEAVIEAAKTLKKSMMLYLFTYGPVPIDEAEQVPLKETEIGMVPEGWEIVKLEEIALISMGQSPNGDTYNDKNIGMPLLNGPTEFGRCYPLPKTWTSAPTKKCEKDDILFCVRGNTTGRMNIADRTYCIGRGLAAIRAKPTKSINNYIFAYLIREEKNLLDIATAGGSTFPNITKFGLFNYKIPSPPLLIQEQISNIFTSIDKKITAEESRKAALDQLFQTLLHDLMTAKIRVNHISVPVAET